MAWGVEAVKETWRIWYRTSHWLFYGLSSDSAYYIGHGWQYPWPRWCTGLYALPSVAPYGQMPSSYHTRLLNVHGLDISAYTLVTLSTTHTFQDYSYSIITSPQYHCQRFIRLLIVSLNHSLKLIWSFSGGINAKFSLFFLRACLSWSARLCWVWQEL